MSVTPASFCAHYYPMGLKEYFTELIEKVESSDIDNQGKDDNGFYKPTKTIILRNLNLLRDLHDKPRAKQMLQTAWKVVAKEVPAEWLITNPENKLLLKSMLSEE